MTTETQATVFERYCTRMMPEALKSDAVPATWPYDPGLWAELLECARDEFANKCGLDFVLAVAGQGYRPEELATGSPVTVDGVGNVYRHPAEYSDAVISRAREAKQALAQAGVRIDTIFEGNLERAATGQYAGHEDKVNAAIEAAEQAVRLAHAERQAAVADDAKKPILNVLVPFRGPRGLAYSKGSYRISRDMAEELNQWLEVMQEQAKGRTLDSLGFRIWPVFEIQEPTI